MSADIGLLVLRVVLGLSIAAHGAQKSYGWLGGRGIEGWTRAVTNMRFRPVWFWTRASAWGEFWGGVLLAAGFLTPLMTVPIICAMLVAMKNTHWANGFWNGNRGYEFNLLIIAASVAVGLAGPGAISVDALLGLASMSAVMFVPAIVVGVVGVVLAYATRKEAQSQPQAQPAAGGSLS